MVTLAGSFVVLIICLYIIFTASRGVTKLLTLLLFVSIVIFYSPVEAQRMNLPALEDMQTWILILAGLLILSGYERKRPEDGDAANEDTKCTANKEVENDKEDNDMSE